MDEEEGAAWLSARGFVKVGRDGWYLPPGADPKRVTVMCSYSPEARLWYMSVASSKCLGANTPREALAHAARAAAHQLKLAQCCEYTINEIVAVPD